jgi:hypothetical protein
MNQDIFSPIKIAFSSPRLPFSSPSSLLQSPCQARYHYDSSSSQSKESKNKENKTLHSRYSSPFKETESLYPYSQSQRNVYKYNQESSQSKKSSQSKDSETLYNHEMYKEQESDYNESVGRKMTRKELKKLRNRLAQQKSRQKKLNTIYSLQMRVEELQKQLQEKNLLLRMLGH